MNDAMAALDDLGAPVRLPGVARRVVSLVPSLTEALAAADPGAIVAATQWCTFPADLDVPRIRGTKNPDCRAIIAMRPDLVIANQEENREIDVRRLRDAGIAVWVTRIRSVEEAHSSIARMFAQALAWPVPGWLRQSEQVWMTPPSLGDLTAAAVIWRDPWMVVGSQTFAGDVLSRLGISNPYATHAERYPVVDVEVLDSMGLEAILLPNEPYPFTLSDGPDALPRTPTALIDGRMLTWYGPSLLEARDHLETSIRAVMRG